MRGRFAVVALVFPLALTGCLAGFQHPLGSVEQSFIDEAVLGSWECTSSDDPEPADLTFIDFDGSQYLLQFDGRKEGRSSHRVIATRVRESKFLSLHPVAPKSQDEWTFLQYSSADADHLSLKLVDPQPFEDVIDDATAVRERLAEHLEDPEVIQDLLSCSRREPPDEQPQP